MIQAGQSASITATLAGQIVSEGFIQWKTSASHAFQNSVQQLMTALLTPPHHTTHWGHSCRSHCRSGRTGRS